MVAHDVLTPPVVLQGFAELLLRDRYGPLNDAQKRTAGKIHANVEKLVGMMEQLLAFSRLLKRLREAAPGSVPVVGVLEREATRIRKEAFSPKLVLSVGENMGDACVAADEAGLAFLIRNVLHNVACLAETDGAV